VYGFNWERNLEGTFNLFSKSDRTFAQFGADPAIPSLLNSKLSLNVSKKRTEGIVSPQDYLFKIFLSSKSSTSELNRSNSVISASVKFDFSDNTNETRELKHSFPNYKKGQFELTDSSLLPTVQTSFRVKNEYNNRFRIRLHRLNWFYEGNEPGAHIGTKGSIPAGIDPIFGGLSFGGRITIFGE